MLKLNVKGKEYTLKFGYKTMAKSGLLKEVVDLRKLISDKKQDDKDQDNSEEIAEMLPTILDLNTKLVLAALQRHYHEDFGVDYDNADSVKACIEKVYDFLDDYMDEDDSMGIMDLFQELTGELFENGFLSKKSSKLEQAATEQDATTIPMDHQRTEN